MVTRKSSVEIPSSTLYSNASRRTITGIEVGMDDLIFEIISTNNLALFSALPPYSSVRLLTAGDKKLEIR